MGELINEFHFYSKWLQTALVISFGLLIGQLIRVAVNRALKKYNFSLQRRRITVKALSLMLLFVLLLTITAIWGIQKHDLLIFLSTTLTVLGVAFFAQWSILSNITSGLILFFHHPLKIGDIINIQDKDYPLTGKVTDITYFFIHIRTDEGKVFTIPNTIVLYKMIQIIEESQQPK